MEKPYFVMLQYPSGDWVPMLETGDSDDVAFYETSWDAADAAKKNPLGENFGYEIFEIGTGET